MRFKKKKPELNDTREVVKFAFLPVRILDHIVWFEKYVSRQIFRRIPKSKIDPYGCSGYYNAWEEVSRTFYEG